MTDSTWIRAFNGKSIYAGGAVIRTDGQFQVGNDGNKFKVDANGNETLAGNLFVNGVVSLKNSIQYRGSKSTNTMISFKNNTSDPSGNGIVIGGGGLTVIGSGESASTIAASYGGGDEHLVLASDTSIQIYTNCDGGVNSAIHTEISGNRFSGAAALLQGSDTRSTNDTPSALMGRGKATLAMNFKDNTFLGNSGAGQYSAVMDIVP